MARKAEDWGLREGAHIDLDNKLGERYYKHSRFL